MRLSTLSDFRQNMKKHLEQIEKDQDILVLKGPKEKNYVVMSLDHYNNLEENHKLVSSPEDARELRRAIAELEFGEILRYEYITIDGKKERVAIKGFRTPKSKKK